MYPRVYPGPGHCSGSVQSHTNSCELIESDKERSQAVTNCYRSLLVTLFTAMRMPRVGAPSQSISVSIPRKLIGNARPA